MTLLTRLLGLCEHEYEEKEIIRYWGKDEEYPIYKRIVQECTKCHKIRTFDV